jgi:uncharacterized repeat protein (TIGR01451 family)
MTTPSRRRLAKIAEDDAMKTLFGTVLAAFLAVTTAAGAATITIVNNDGAGEGFNDPTPVAALPNNPGTTLGQQRLNLFNAAAQQWAAVLNSSVPILVRAQFDPQTCDATGAVLGSAGPWTVAQNFTNRPIADTWFVIAQANALAGSDLSAANPDINTTFNASIDSGCLGGVSGWWYGLDDSVAVPADKIPLLPVVFHELAHGLGFLTVTNTSNGQLAGTPGRPDIWAHYLADANLGSPYTLWKDMTNNQRAASAIDDPFLVWAGAHTNAAASSYMDPLPALTITAPPAIAGSYQVQPASYGPAVPLAGISGSVVLALDTGASSTDGCEALTNPAAVAGKIALIDRGSCNFSVKTMNAQNAGAIAVLIANNVADGLPPMGGSDPAVTIPSYGITQAAGNSIKANLAGGVSATLGYDLTKLAGQTNGLIRMYAPNPREAGSSVSHFTNSASPRLLMEPALNEEIFGAFDLTLPLFRDIFWPLNPQPNIGPTLSAAAVFNAQANVLSPLTEVFFSDVDSGDANLSLTFAVAAGTVQLQAQPGVTLSGSGSASATASAPRLLLLQYVVGGNVQYLSTPEGTSPVALTLTVNDNGNSGTGGAKSASTVASIVVAPGTPTTPATVTLSNLTRTYTGSPLGATVTTSPAGLAVSVTYAGSATLPTNAGTYAIVATVTEPGYSGSASGSFVIEQAAATVTLSNLSQTFTGSPRPVTVATSPVGLSTSVTYDGSTQAPTAVGSYPVVATVTDANYSGSASGTLEVAAQPLADLTVTKSNNADTVVAGSRTTYTIIVTNAGAAPAQAVVTDNVPATLGAANWTCSASNGAACGAEAGSGSLSEDVLIPAGGALTFHLSATVTGPVGGTVVNTATAELAEGSDPTPGNNTATDSDEIVAAKVFADGFE